MDGPDCEHYAPTPGLELVKGVLSHVAAAGRDKDHVVAVVDIRCAYVHAEPLPKTFVELPHYYDLDTLTRCCGRVRRVCTGRDRMQGRGNVKIEKGIKAAGMVMGKMLKCCG